MVYFCIQLMNSRVRMLRNPIKQDSWLLSFIFNTKKCYVCYSFTPQFTVPIWLKLLDSFYIEVIHWVLKLGPVGKHIYDKHTQNFWKTKLKSTTTKKKYKCHSKVPIAVKTVKYDNQQTTLQRCRELTGFFKFYKMSNTPKELWCR